MIFALEYLGDRRLRKPILMAEQKQYPLLHSLALDRMRLGPLAIVVDLQLSISVIFISIVLVNHFSDYPEHLLEFFVVVRTTYLIFPEITLKT